MISSTFVKAWVVDIRDSDATMPRRVVVDANILYFVYYDSAALTSVGGKGPAHYQATVYPRWWSHAVSKKVELCTAMTCLAEFAHIVERTELELLWRMDPVRPELDPANPSQDYTPRYAKTVRYLYANQLEMIRLEVETSLLSLRKTVELLPKVGQDADIFAGAVKEWLPAISDFSDAILVAAAKRVGIFQIISDDADLITFEGITVYTANRNAIESASAAGKLIT